MTQIEISKSITTMSPAAIIWVPAIASLAGVAALALAFFGLPKEKRPSAYLATVVFFGTPLVVVVYGTRTWIFVTVLVAYILALTVCVAAVAYLRGRGSRASVDAPLDLVAITAQRPNAEAWLTEQIRVAKAPIVIDALGVKDDTLYRVLRMEGRRRVLPLGVECTVRVLILKENCEGARQRAVIERHDKVLHDAESAGTLWSQLSATTPPALSVEVRSYTFCPSLYIIRINDAMFVGGYTGGIGYESMTLDIRRQDGQLFDQYQNLFERIWADLSQPVAPEPDGPTTSQVLSAPDGSTGEHPEGSASG
jgi:hypothetical protein